MSVCIGYGRVSTVDQADSEAIQTDQLRKRYDVDFAEHGYEWGGVLFDRGVSGRTPLSQRPLGAELCKRLKKDDMVLIAKLDRGFRSLHDMLNCMANWRELGIGLTVLNLGVNSSKPEGRFMLHILAALAEFERDLIAERTREAAALRRAQGRPVAGPPPYGFKILKRHGQKRLYPDPAQRALGSKIVKWRDVDGFTWEAIYLHMHQVGLRRPNGREYALGTIRNYYFKELALREFEDRGDSMLQIAALHNKDYSAG